MNRVTSVLRTGVVTILTVLMITPFVFIPHDSTVEASVLDNPISTATTVNESNWTVVEISSRQAWTDTGLVVARGDFIFIKATGSVNYAPTSPATGPDGTSNAAGGSSFLVLDPSVRAQSLVGNVGAAASLDGKGFFVGSDFQARVPIGNTSTRTGRLFLGFNDGFIAGDRSGMNQGAVDDNYGSFWASISVLSSYSKLSITTDHLADAVVDASYSVPILVAGGVPPYTWSVTGALPPGLSLDESSGIISGTICVTSNDVGFFVFTIKVGDSVGTTATKEFSITVLFPRHDDSFSWNGFLILNNQWGLGEATRQSYQRIMQREEGIVFEYSWWTDPGKDQGAVKGYPAIIAGWHNGDPIRNGPFRTPPQISASERFVTSVHASHANIRRRGQVEKLNLSWDIWLAKSQTPGNSPPSGEIMVWPWWQEQQPLTKGTGGGLIESRVKIGNGNAEWDIYGGTQIDKNGNSWPVITFRTHKNQVYGSNAISASLDLKDFIERACFLPAPWALDSSQYIVGVEFGSEVVQGEGSWTITSYSLQP